MVFTRSCRYAMEANESYARFEFDQATSDDQPAKNLEARRATLSPTKKTKRTLYLNDSDTDESEYEEDVEESPRKRAKRLKHDPTPPPTPVLPEDTGAAVLFKSIPVEIHQQIALYLPADRDLLNYSLICKKTASAVTYSVWRQRFSKFFDHVDGLTSKVASEKYAFRKYVCANWTCFDLDQFGGRISRDVKIGQARNQLDLLNVLRGLLSESNATMVNGRRKGWANVEGLNLNFIEDMLKTSECDIVDSIFNTSFDKEDADEYDKILTANDKNSLVYVIQLLLTPFSLDPEICNGKVCHFDISQYQAYATAKRQPAFLGYYKQAVNVRWLLHIVNFFKFHLKAAGEGLLAHEYRNLGDGEFPQFWTGRIKGGTQPLARHWKGIHTYMEDDTLMNLRDWGNSSVHTDSLDGNESFEDMDFFFDKRQIQSYEWPESFELLLCSNPFEDPELKHRAEQARISMAGAGAPDVKQFWGSCKGSHRGHFFGRVHAMTTQQGIHGFQRLTMMKFYVDTDENGHDIYDWARAWCYEGCVLPGGRIVVGRWWTALADPNANTTVSGPFLWWNTHKGGDDFVLEFEALEFMENFKHLM